MARPRLVALYSDFGNRDVYAGVLRAILRTRAPESEGVDICHEVPAGDRHADHGAGDGEQAVSRPARDGADR